MELNLTDKTYDGDEKNDYLTDGLGQLVDGQKGYDNYKVNVSGNGKGKRQFFFFFLIWLKNLIL